MLHAFFVASFVATAVLPAFHTLAILQIVLPVAFVLGAIHVNVNSVSVGLVVLPFAFVDVAVGMPELSATVSLVFPPFTFVLGIVWPDLHSWSVPHLVLKISFINCSVFEGKFLNELQALPHGSLLKIEQVLVLGIEQVWHIFSGRRYILLILHLLRVVL